ncbi:hypothetical protein VPH35_132298 [Triticum aestivum]
MASVARGMGRGDADADGDLRTVGMAVVAGVHGAEQVVPDPAHVQTSINIDYTAFPGTRLSHEQDRKVLELAQSSMRSEYRLHVATVNKANAKQDCHVYIPLTLLDSFKEGITEAPIQLKAHSNDMIYVVGASKHGDDQVILQSELSHFVDGHRMQDNDLLVFRSKGKAQLEVLVLDPSGCEKTWFDTGNSSNVSREGLQTFPEKAVVHRLRTRLQRPSVGLNQDSKLVSRMKQVYKLLGPTTTYQPKRPLYIANRKRKSKRGFEQLVPNFLCLLKWLAPVRLLPKLLW